MVNDYLKEQGAEYNAEEGSSLLAYLLQVFSTYHTNHVSVGSTERSGKQHRSWSHGCWVQSLTLPLASSMTLSKLVSPSEPPFPLCKMERIIVAYLIALL